MTTTAYDAGDRVLTVTDPASRTTKFNYCTTNDLPNCAANQVDKEIRAWSSGNACSVSGTLQECYRRVTYLPDGEELTIRDANGNTTTYGYDGFNRLNLTTFPDTTTEQLTPDANGNITKRITRASQEIDYVYNALNWMTQKTPSPAANWTYLLDGRIDKLCDVTACGTPGNIIDYGYDTAGRMTQVATRLNGFNANRTVNYTLDANGNRTQLQWPTQDAAYAVGYCYDSLNRMTQAQENTTDCTSNLLATYAYDPQSRRTNLTYGNGTQVQTPSATAYSAAGDLLNLTHDLTGSTNDNTFTYAYTNAHQTNTIAASNAAWLWQPPTNTSTAYTVNNLNQYPTIGTQTTGGTNCQGTAQGLSYDCNDNVTSTTDPRLNVTTSLYDLDRRKTEDDHHDGNASAALNAASKTLYDEIMALSLPRPHR